MKLRSLLMGVVLAGLVSSAHASISVSDLGTAAPPATLGGYAMTPFPADPQQVGSTVTSVASPLGGSVSFDSGVRHATIGSGWATWSNGYTGDVYATTLTSLNMTLPGSTGAFYFYAEPDQFATFNITATASDGTTLTEAVSGQGGANGFGLFASTGESIASILVTATDPTGFAVGEFGIAATTAVTAVPEPSTALIATVAGIAVLGVHRLRRRCRAAV